MAESEVPKGLGDGKVYIEDGGALSYEVIVEDGDVSFEEAWYERELVYDREAIYGSTKGKLMPGKGQLTVDLRQFSDANDANIYDVIKGTNAWAAMTSTGGNKHREKTHKIRYVVTGAALGDGADHQIAFGIVAFKAPQFKEGNRHKIVIPFDILSEAVRTGPA
jgi:hypothetical protein